MRKWMLFTALVLVINMWAYAASGRRYHEKEAISTLIYTVTLSGAQTQTELVTAITGVSFVVDKIICASATAGVFYLSDTTGADVDYGYGAVPTSGSFIDNEVNIKFAAGEAIDITTTQDLYVHLEYHNE